MKLFRDVLDSVSILFGVICLGLSFTGNLDLNNISSLLCFSGTLLLIQAFK